MTLANDDKARAAFAMQDGETPKSSRGALERSLAGLELVVRTSRDPEQRARCKAAADELRKQLNEPTPIVSSGSNELRRQS